MQRWIGGGLLALGMAIAGWVGFFHVRSNLVGSRLVDQYLTVRAASFKKPVSDRKAPHHTKPSWPAGVIGVVEIPRLHETAPIVRGTSMDRLAIGVGHLNASVLPGQSGTSVLAGHNVTWFHRINELSAGDRIVVIRGDSRLTFAVTRRAIVRQGAPIIDTRQPTLVLESCYPLNALYFTPDRYLLWARLIGQTAAGTKPQVVLGADYRPIGIPSALAKEGLTLSTNQMPMGHLHFLGRPSAAFEQTDAPLSAASATTTLYFGALHALLQHRQDWGRVLGIAQSNPAWQLVSPSDKIEYLSRADESLTLFGRTVWSTQLSVTVRVVSPTGAKAYHIIMHTSVQNRQLRLRSWAMLPVR